MINVSWTSSALEVFLLRSHILLGRTIEVAFILDLVVCHFRMNICELPCRKVNGIARVLNISLCHSLNLSLSLSLFAFQIPTHGHSKRWKTLWSYSWAHCSRLIALCQSLIQILILFLWMFCLQIRKYVCLSQDSDDLSQHSEVLASCITLTAQGTVSTCVYMQIQMILNTN